MANKCVQTITPDDWSRGEDAAPQHIAYDAARRRLVTAAKRVSAWQNKLVQQDTTGHRAGVARVLYNSAFSYVVSADECAPLFPTRTPALSCHC